MDPVVAPQDHQIQQDVDALRDRFTNTQDLYREACSILFFRYGITPTANKLYQYVRKGSMSAPATALGKFWEDLREKSRVRIENPDLPDAVRAAAGELVGNLWSLAQAAAQDGLALLRADANARIEEAQERQGSAERRLAELTAALQVAREDARVEAEKALDLEKRVAALQASNDALGEQRDEAVRRQEGLERSLAEARADFAGQLDQIRQAQALSEERHRAAESRALLEIDRERTRAASLEKELAHLRLALDEQADRHRIEAAADQQIIGDQKQRIGVLEGELRGIGSARDALATDLARERAANQDLRDRLDQANRETAKLQERAVLQPRASDPPRFPSRGQSPLPRRRKIGG